MKQEIELSIIIPCYNASKTIIKCLESLVNFNGINFEVVCIDDGSTDDTADLISKCNYPWVKLIRQANGGVSSARNRGILEAKGKNLVFIDSDDHVLPFDTEKFGTIVVNDYDFILLNYYENGVLRKDYLGETLSKNVIENLLFSYKMNSVCDKVFSRDIIKTYDIKFCDGMMMGEDFLFVLEYFSHCRNFKATNIAYYNYVYNSESATHSYDEKALKDFCFIFSVLKSDDYYFSRCGEILKVLLRNTYSYLRLINNISHETLLFLKQSEFYNCISNLKTLNIKNVVAKYYIINKLRII